jgi:FixJ family two-component response regulator
MSEGTNTTVFVVDDDPSVLKALTRLLKHAGYEVEAYISPMAFLEGHDPEKPGCALLDVGMAEVNGLELQRELMGERARPVIFITGAGDIPTSVAAMKAGALDFLTKPVDEETLLSAVSKAIENDSYARRLRNELAEVRERLGCLTPREREVLSHVVGGRLNKQIAGDLGTVEKTIKVHRARVMEKMGVRSVAELVRTAERLGVAPFRSAGR